MARLYVARTAESTTVSRSRLRRFGGEPVRHPWSALVDVTMPERRHSDLMLVTAPPVATALITAATVSIEAGAAAGAIVLLATSYLTPLVRRRLFSRGARGPASRGDRGQVSRGDRGPASRGDRGQVSRGDRGPASRGDRGPAWRGASVLSLFGRLRAGRGPRPGIVTLTEPAERAAFDEAVAAADEFAGTWSELGTLIDPTAAEALLADALGEFAAVLTRRQELTAVLAQLSRPDFMARPPADPTARELHAQLRATKAALADLDADLAHRRASLTGAAAAGREFIRDQEMRSAIRAAEESLRSTHRPDPPA
jgi:hypothetical protein